MATDHLNPTRTGEAAPTTYPLPTSETRDFDDTTRGGSETITNLGRRRLLVAMSGGLAVALTGGGLAVARYVFRDEDATPPPDRAVPPVAPSAVEARPISPEDLTLSTIRMPETLNPPTFKEVVENAGEAVQFAVNHNAQAELARYIPGGETGVLLPDQFQLRASFIDGYRHVLPGDPSDPTALQHYAWGFSLTFQELVTGEGFDPQDERGIHKFVARVRVRMGDLPPLVNSDHAGVELERPQDFETTVTMTRWQGYLDANQQYQPLPNLPGQPGHGWGISNMGQMYPVPPFMTGVNLPKGFSSVPPIYNQHKPK